MIRRWLACGAGMVLALLAVSSATPAWAADTGPTLRLSQPTARIGTYEVVTGSGFVHGAEMQLEICGIGGSSNSCDLQDAVLATADATGSFTAHLRVSEPPTPCPCTVHAAPFAGNAESPVDADIAIPGLRFMPDAAPKTVGVAKLMDVAVTDDSSPFVQIGGKGSAQVTITFANLSGGPAGDPGVALVLSHGSQTVGRYPVRWTGDDLAVGRRRSLVYDLPLPGGWFRDFSIAVVIGQPGDKQITARTVPASVRPWGELIAPAAFLLGITLLLLGRRRHYEVVAPLPVREGAPMGRRNGVVGPAPFARVEAATLGIAELPGAMAAPVVTEVPTGVAAEKAGLLPGAPQSHLSQVSTEQSKPAEIAGGAVAGTAPVPVEPVGPLGPVGPVGPVDSAALPALSALSEDESAPSAKPGGLDVF